MNLNKIIEDLNSYKNIDKEKLLTDYINQRLTDSLTTYYKELDKSMIYVAARNNSERSELKILKKIGGRRI